MADLFGSFVRAAPGVLAKRQAGINTAEQESYKRKQQQDEIQREAEARAFQELMAQRQLDENIGLRRDIQSQNEQFRRDQLKTLDQDRDAQREQAKAINEGNIASRYQQFREAEEGRNERAKDRNAITSALRGLGGGMNFNQIAKLRGEFERVDKPYAIASTAAKQAKALANDKTGQSDMALMYSYIKVLDPESVVREGEYAVATRAASVPDRVGNMVRRALSGQQLSPEQRANLVAAIETKMGPTREQYLRKRKYYQDLATKFGGDPFDVLGVDPDEGVEQPPKSRRSLADIAGGVRNAKPFEDVVKP